ncbi:MAG: AAA family ATPase [Candidatus Spechtbacterales bacterium]
MYVKVLELKNFKKFKEARIEFPGDISIIKGKNEQGKSSVVEALLAALFFDPTLPIVPKYVKDYQSWHSEKLYQLILYFEAGGENFVLEKDFVGQKIILRKDSGDVISHDFDEISKKLSEMGGYTNKDLFSNLGIIKKDSLVLMDAGKRKIMEALQEMVTGSAASVSVGEIIKRTQDAQAQLTKGTDSKRPVKNVGKIKMLQDSIAEAQKALNNTKEDADKRQQLLEEFDATSKNLTRLIEQAEILEYEHQTNEKYFKTKLKIDETKKELDDVLDDLSAYENLEKEKEELTRSLSELKVPGQREFEKAEELQRNMDSAQDRSRELGELINSLRAHRKNKYYPSRNNFFIISGLLLAFGFAGFWVKFFFVSWILFAVFVVFYFISGQYKTSLKLAELEKEQDRKKSAISEFNEQVNTVFKKFNAATLADLRNIPGKIKEIKQHIDSLENQQKTVLRNKKLSSLENRKKELQVQLAIEEEKITDEQKASPPQPTRQRELEKKIEKTKHDIENTKEDNLTLKAKIENIKQTAEDVLEQEERILNLQNQIETLTRRAQKYEILASVLQEARDKSLIKIKEALEGMMGEYIGEITGGRYMTIRLNNEFDLEVLSPDKGDYVSADNLSTGALDQLYIVARFALIAILYGKASAEKHTRRPTVILDDPFGNFDEERRNKTRGILERLSANFQIIFFTCVSDYDDWGALTEI